MRRWTDALAALALSLGTLVPRAYAVDGVIEINHTCAVTGGCFQGDTPGYPVTVVQPGSYRLTSNLRINVGVGLAGNTDGITITVDDVTLDLNGFTVSCTRTSIPSTPCTNTGGTGRGILSSGENVRVRNGTIRDFAGNGVQVLGSYVVDGVRSRNNGGSGFDAASASSGQIFRSVFAGNQATGLLFHIGSYYMLEGIRSSGNVGFGLQGLGSSHGQILRSTFHDNFSAGLSFAASSSALVLESKTEGNSEAFFLPASVPNLRVGNSLLVDGSNDPPLGFPLIACVDSGGLTSCPIQ